MTRPDLSSKEELENSTFGQAGWGVFSDGAQTRLTGEKIRIFLPPKNPFSYTTPAPLAQHPSKTIGSVAETCVERKKNILRDRFNSGKSANRHQNETELTSGSG
jgi:hypothetical protein